MKKSVRSNDPGGHFRYGPAHAGDIRCGLSDIWLGRPAPAAHCLRAHSGTDTRLPTRPFLLEVFVGETLDVLGQR